MRPPHVWATHVYDPSPQAEFILDTISVHRTITPQFSYIRPLYHKQPIEKIHPLISYPQKFPNYIPLFMCVGVQRHRQGMEARQLRGHVSPLPKWQNIVAAAGSRMLPPIMLQGVVGRSVRFTQHMWCVCVQRLIQLMCESPFYYCFTETREWVSMQRKLAPAS